MPSGKLTLQAFKEEQAEKRRESRGDAIGLTIGIIVSLLLCAGIAWLCHYEHTYCPPGYYCPTRPGWL